MHFNAIVQELAVRIARKFYEIKLAAPGPAGGQGRVVHAAGFRGSPLAWASLYCLVLFRGEFLLFPIFPIYKIITTNMVSVRK